MKTTLPATPLRFFWILLMLGSSVMLRAQSDNARPNYLGLLPSFLAEPYDTIKALEVNVLPFVYERKLNAKQDLALQIRPIVNYRFYKPAPGISQTGGTLLINKYFRSLFAEDSWLTLQAALYGTYTYNLLDEIQTLTVGVEAGVQMSISEKFSLSVNVQPGINYYPDDFSREFVRTESGFKSHFGIMFHIGHHF